jgi:hypothetical protein
VNRILRGTVAANGYRMVSAGTGRPRYLHELVGVAFLGPRPKGHVMRHLNGDKLDNRVVNLTWGTQRENLLDIVAHGRHERANRTHCPLRHLLAAPNLVADDAREGRRSCLACSRARAVVSNARRTGRPVPDIASLADEKYAAILRKAEAH